MGSRPKPFQLKLYPNREFSIHLQRKSPVESISELERTEEQEHIMRAVKAHGIEPVRDYLKERNAASALGLSTPRNLNAASTRPGRYGLKGMPGAARKKVRNAAYLLERAWGKRNLSFVTLTLPSLELNEMSIIHERWNAAAIAVRQKISRLLEAQGIEPEIVTISEIQEKRYESTGLPVLHFHLLFRGRKARKRWAISPSQINDVWEGTLSNILGRPVSAPSAARIEPVRKSAEGYIGKYMSKGIQAVTALVEDGWEWWLPRQWWGMTRNLSHQISRKIRISHESGSILWHAALDGVQQLFEWVKPVYINGYGDEQYLVAFYGKLTTECAACI